MTPTWYTPFTLRESWMGALQPVVGLVGLDMEGGDSVDRRVWELLNISADLAPTFILNPNLPHKKPSRREGLELTTYVPEGLLPVTWADKHRSLIPAVIVIFFKDDAPITVNKALGKLREDCNAFGTQLLVMLIKGPGDEELSTERASALCAAADIPPKSLYILVTSHPDRIQASVQRLERGIREGCTAYYAARVRRLKTNKERTTQLALHIRYNLKLGFFFEIRRDYASAVSHYESAMDALIRMGIGFQQVKVLASIINYRIARLHLLKREWSEAKIKFHKHVGLFQNSALSSHDDYAFEILAFLEQQYQHFGDLVKQYYGPESNNALDPVSYFIAAAKCAQQRADLLQKRRLKGQILTQPPEQVDLTWEPKFLGQRPWGLDEDINKLPLLQYLESQSPHSDLVIKHLGLASEFCKDIGRHRTRCQLMSMMGDEFLRSGEFARCILLMAHVLREFGKERWGHLLLHAAQAGLTAAISLPDVSAYLNFVVLLLKQDLKSLLGEKHTSLLSSNLDAVIEKRIPEHEGINVAAFATALNSGEIKSYVGVHCEPFLVAWIGFTEESVSVHRTTSVLFRLQNIHERPVHIKSIGIQTNIPEYDVNMVVNKILEVGAKFETSLDITPRDSNKVIQLQVGVVDIGKGDVCVLLHYSLIHKAPLTLWNEYGEERTGLNVNVMKVEGSRPLLQCRVQRQEPALVGEAHAVTFIWTNSDSTSVSRLLLTFFLSTTNPQFVRLSAEPGQLEEGGSSSSGGGLSHSVEVDKLGPGDSQQTTLYLRVLAETELRLISKAKYIDSVGQPVNTDFFTPVSVISPFALSTSLRDSQGEVLPSLIFSQTFVLHHQLTNMASTPLCLTSLRFKDTNTCVVQHGGSAGDVDSVLQPSETVSSLQLMQLRELPSPGLNNITSIVVQWSKEGKNMAVVTSELTVPMPRVDFESAGLCLTGEFGEAYLKRPLSSNYVLVNRSPHCCDLTISIDSTEYFMNAGPKKMNVKLNGGDHINLSYILFPLKTGLVVAPRLLVEGIDMTQPLVIHRDHPRTVFVRRVDEQEMVT